MSAPTLDRPSSDSRPDSRSAAPASVFAQLPADLLAALARQGITDPTPVQAAVLPDALAGRDLLGRAQTGSGKTLAFGLPVLMKLAGRRSRALHPRALIVVPTRELANQVTTALTPLSEALRLRLVTVYGGTPYDRQVRKLRQRADIVVATPGRLHDLIERRSCVLDDVEITVLDEADHLCDLGFYPTVDKLVAMTPAGSQRLLLSATLDGDVDQLVRSHLRNPVVHELDPNAGAVTTMAHHTLVVGGFKAKVDAAVDLVGAHGRSIVFTRTREGAISLAEALTEAGVNAVDLHGDLSQRVRERNLRRFSSGGAQAVVATDVAARGIHVDKVDLVIHFDPASDSKSYLHRSGRTARAGQTGCVVTLSTPKVMQQVARMQAGAGVEVRHHDVRTTPRPMTAATLAEAGQPAAPVGQGGSERSSSGTRSGNRYGGARSGERSGARSGERFGERTGAPRRSSGHASTYSAGAPRSGAPRRGAGR